jgi:hypothetical protein
MPEAYDSLDPVFKRYVDALLEHARSALWPERRAALESFYRGIARSDPKELSAAAQALALDLQSSSDAAGEAVFRRLLTAYLSCLEEPEITNLDQAYLHALSLDPAHAECATRWFDANPQRVA